MTERSQLRSGPCLVGSHERKHEEEVRHELMVHLKLFMRASGNESDEVELYAESDDEGEASDYFRQSVKLLSH